MRTSSMSKPSFPKVHTSRALFASGYSLRPNIVEYLFWGSGVLVLILSSYWLQYILNDLYRVSFVIFALASVLCVSGRRALMTSPGIWIICFAMILGLMVIAGHGDRIQNSFYMFIRSIPFFMLGYSVSRYKSFGIKIVLGISVVAYTAICAHDLLKIIGNISYFATRQSMAAELINLNPNLSENTIVGKLIYHYPFIALLAMCAISIYDEKSVRLKVLITLCISVLLVAVLFSFWVAPTLILLTGFAIMGLMIFMHHSTSYRKKINILILTFLFVISLVITVNHLERSESYAANTYAKRIKGIPSAIFGKVEGSETFDELSGGRITLIKVSIKSFVESPIIGTGDYYFGTLAGGHSLWFDALARYGLIGAIPLYVFSGLFLVMSYRNWRMTRFGYTNLAFLVTLYSWAISGIMNPYMLMSNMDYIVLIAAGIVTGRYYKNRRCRITLNPSADRTLYF